MRTPVSGGFIGRQAELRALVVGLERARAGSGRMVIVSGEGGAGKTRPSEELASAAHALDAGVAWAVCWESGALPSFWPWRQLLDQLGADVELPG